MSKEGDLLAEKCRESDRLLSEKKQQDILITSLQKDIDAYRQREQDAKQETANAKQETANAKQETAAVKDKLDALKDKHESLLQSFMDAMRQRFGKKSERFIEDTGVEQLPIFDSPQAEAAVPDKKEDVEDITYTRRKGKQPTDTTGIPVREEIVSVDASQRTCECCGNEKACIGYEEKYMLDYQPAVFEMLHQKREKLACKNNCSDQKQKVVTAHAPHILPKSRVTENLLAHICVSKVLDRQPLYHLEKRIERENGWRIQRKTMARWLIQLSDKLMPLINLMKDTVLNYDVSAIDATTLQVLNEPNRPTGKKTCFYCIRGGPPDKAVTVYEYNAYSHKDYLTGLFDGYTGYIHSDAAPVYKQLPNQDGKLTFVYCHAHARRYFEKITKTGTHKKTKAIANDAMRFYRKLYDLEDDAKQAATTPQQLTAYRDTHQKPLLEKHEAWLKELLDRASSKSPLGKAVRYSLNHWKELNNYLKDGRLSLDNNATERAIRPFVTARKNFMFAATPEGADALGVHFSLIMSAKEHGLNPFTYYQTVLKQIPSCQSFDDYEKLLPWNLTHRLNSQSQ